MQYDTFILTLSGLLACFGGERLLGFLPNDLKPTPANLVNRIPSVMIRRRPATEIRNIQRHILL